MEPDNKEKSTAPKESYSAEELYSQEQERKHRKFKKVTAFLKLGFLLVIIIGVPLYIYFFQHQLIDNVSSTEKVQQLLNSNKMLSIPIYIAPQIVQIVICIIPGQWLQMGAGLAWGFWAGYLYSLIGALIGSVLTYYIANWLGKDAMYVIFGQEKMNTYVEKLRSKRAIVIVFLIFLIPGVPKDLCNYAAGISEMKLKPFLAASLLGRTPGMMGSLLIGKHIGTSSYTTAIIIGVVAVLLFVLGLVFHKKIFELAEKRGYSDKTESIYNDQNDQNDQND